MPPKPCPGCTDLHTQLREAQENLRWAREQAESDSRKVQQAQEERDKIESARQFAADNNARLREERDAAIGRGKTVLYWLHIYVRSLQQANAYADATNRRAERAEALAKQMVKEAEGMPEEGVALTIAASQAEVHH